MKKMVLLVILAGLLLVGAGCGGGGDSGSQWEEDILTTNKTIDMRTPASYDDLGLRYTVTTSRESSNTVTMYITSIKVTSNKTLVVNCAWKAINNSGCEQITKLSDNLPNVEQTFYMYANNNRNNKYYHTSGTGAAYTETELSSTAVSGSFTFPALNRGVTSIYFYDSIYEKTFGPIAVSGL